MSIPTRTVEPLLSLPPRRLFEAAAQLPTPSLVYDGPGVRSTLSRMVEDVQVIPGARMNLALKACHTPGVLSLAAACGVGADVASLGELELAREAGFHEISATGPSFRPAHFAALDDAGVVLDANSPEQIEEWGAAHPGGEVGLRLRIPLPESMRSGVTFGENSRFGMTATDPRMIDAVNSHALHVTRLHLHTGQMTPAHLVYKMRYLLTVADSFPDLELLDFGGGFFYLYADRGTALAALEAAAADLARWTQRTGRELRIRFEPGGAVLAPYGYLFTEVLSVEPQHPYFGKPIVTVDSSAWNFAPWHKPEILLADPHQVADTGVDCLVAGNTLYENDFFGTDVLGHTPSFFVPSCAAGDRLVVTASGAYTMTNSRRFNRLPQPSEWMYDDGVVVPLS